MSDLTVTNALNDDPAEIDAALATAESIAQLHHVPTIMRAALRIALKMKWGDLTVVLPDGQAIRYLGEHPGKHGILVIRDYKFARKIITHGGSGMAEAYLEGTWDSPDLPVFLEVVARNADYVREYFHGQSWSRMLGKFLHFLNRNSKSGSKKNIEFHYDLGNAFYTRWLDPTMTYSSAKFDAPNQSLDQAQWNKYRTLTQQADMREGHSVLEIGCGWGGFAEFAATEVGCHVTGITISKEQLEFAQKRIFDKGLNEKVDIVYRDYRDVEGQYDRVASIEMFEAVGEKYWPSFFGKVHDVLKSGGQAGLQIITIADKYFDDYRQGADFIQRYIFPGGMLPSPSALADQVRNAGLEWQQNINFGKDYARTLHVWREKFLEAWPEIQDLGFDERFRRMWTLYLGYCEAGFNAGTVDVTQVTLKRT